jgi:hypothetical protein
VDKLKKIFFVCILLISLSIPSMAYMNVDLYGAGIGVNGEKYQFGGGGALGFSVIGNLSILYRGMYTLASSNKWFFDAKYYNYLLQLAGIEHVLSIPYVHIGWRNSIMAGYSQVRLDTVDKEYVALKALIFYTSVPAVRFVSVREVRKPRKLRNTGFAMAYWTGFQFELIRYMTPFIDIGIHKSFYRRDLNNKNIYGLNIMFGVRVSIGRKSSLEEGY